MRLKSHIVIPLTVLVYSLLKAVLALAIIFIAGRLLLRPLFSFIPSDAGSESSGLPISCGFFKFRWIEFSFSFFSSLRFFAVNIVSS